MQDKGQATVFIIIGLIIVAGVVLFLLLRESIVTERIPADLQPPYGTFLDCVKEDALRGIEILEIQGGYLELPELETGSDYMPFSSQLNFVGRPVPYWNYVSASGIQKEKIPSKSMMERHLAEFIDGRIKNCDLEKFSGRGFEVLLGEPDSETEIMENSVKVNLKMEVVISKGNETLNVREHSVSVRSGLGGLYDDARIIYGEELKSSFLENYVIDVLRFYAPVDGVEFSCSPKTWNADEIFDELLEAIETNTAALRTDEEIEGDGYFLVDLPIKNGARFINSRNWPNNLEVNPSEGNLLMASPVGNQQGLGIMGFCYVPYHFVYSLRFPVMVQVYSSDGEFFQFPIVVSVEKNRPEASVNVSTPPSGDSELCGFRNVLTNVNVRSGSVPVDAEIYYECFGERCKMGETENGNLQAQFPQCVNGFVVAEARGFEKKKQIYSTVREGSLNVQLKKIHEMNVKMKSSGIPYHGNAIITFISEGNNKTVNYPNVRKVELSAGIYEIRVYAFENSSLTLREGNKEQCVGSGLNRRCFEIKIPSQLISSVLSGGGKTRDFMSESDLSGSGEIEIGFERLRKPDTLEQLQDNYALIENKDLTINLR